MTITFGELKKICKEKGVAFRAAGLFGASKNDSGKCDCYIETADKVYAVKFISLGNDADFVKFNNAGGGYVSVKGENGTSDFMWVAPKATVKADKPIDTVLLLDSDVICTYKAKNSAVTVTSGSAVFGYKVYTPSGFLKLF